jgi:PAS domain S-box-containing protein
MWSIPSSSRPSSSRALRPSGLPSVGDVPWGSHFCQLYERRDDVVEALASYFAAGLRANERCLWITDDTLSADRARAALAARLADAARYEARGQLEIVDQLALSARSGGETLRALLDAEARALSAGLAGLRVNALVPDGAQTGRRDLFAIEAQLASALRGRHVLALCSYCLGRTTAASLIDVMRAHELALVRRDAGWEILGGAAHSPERRVPERATSTELHETIALRDQLADAERRFRTIFETMPILGWTLRPDGSCDECNRSWCEYTGMSVEELQGSGWHRVHEPSMLPQVIARWEASLSTGTPFEMELPLRRHDGVYRTFLTRAHPIRDASGAIVRWIGVHIDIEDQRRALEHEKAMRETAEQAARFSELFAGILAHDLRNPLSAIVTGGNYLARVATDEKQARSAERIITSGMRMSRMIDQLLDLARIRLGGGLPLERREATLAELCRDVVDELATTHPERAPRLEVYGDTRGCWDVDRVAQVISNVVGNAIQHGSAEVPVTLRIDGREADAVQIVVESGGVIDPEVLPVLFEPFRGERRHDREKARGLGLGLYISQEIVLAHRGRIEVRSTAEEGTSFTITLPRRQRPELAVSGRGGPR